MGWYAYGGFAPYVTVAERKKQAAREITKLKNKGKTIQPVILEGRTIAKTFWGKAWCEHLESYSDYANRLPRGRSYVRHGAVVDLQIDSGEIKALVKGSSVYKIKISIAPVTSTQWNYLIKECAGKIDSLIELLLGKFSKSVMEIMTHPKRGLFPHPNEIKLNCSCPDWAALCKHVAAVLYGIGARFDERPEDLFLLRQANHLELVSKISKTSLVQVDKDQDTKLKDADLSALFGVNIEKKPQQAIIRSQKNRTKTLSSSKNKTQRKKLATEKIKSNNANSKDLMVPKTIKNAKKDKSKKAQTPRQSALTKTNRLTKRKNQKS